MKTVTYTIEINATPERVWHALWDDTNYEAWVLSFGQEAMAVSEWTEGSKVHFISPTGDGICSIIRELTPYQLIRFEHQCSIKNNLEITDTEESWQGSIESYTLEEINGKTVVHVSLDTLENYVDFFDTTFPKALEVVKKIAEEPENKTICVRASIAQPLAKVWDYFTNPDHIIHWNFASEDWHCPKAVTDLKMGGRFVWTMAAKDGSMQFDFEGTFTEIVPFKKIAYTITDGRQVTITFREINDNVIITENFEPERVHSEALQKQGWQQILNHFKHYINQ